MEKYPVIGDVRGKGLFCGAELGSDRKSKEPLEEKRVQMDGNGLVAMVWRSR